MASATELARIPAFGSVIVLNERDGYVITEILAPAAPMEKRGQIVNEGYRFIALGETGSGKTSLMRVVVYTTIAAGYAGFAFIHDTKGVFSEYPRSVQLAHPRDFIARGGFRAGDIPVVSFRGDPRRDVEVSAEEVASFSLAIARRGQLVNGVWRPNPHICVIEEASEAATDGRKHIKAPSVLKLLEQGRKLGVSLVATTQSPRKIPLDMLGQASAISFGRLTGADANYLGERLDMDPAMIAAIRGANNEGLPNYHFVLYVKGKPWDGLIHALDTRTALMFE
jgi:hypothetical protein